VFGNRLYAPGSIGRKLIALVLASLAASFTVTAAVSTWIDVRRQADLESERLTQTARVIGSLAADAVEAGDRGGAFTAVRSVSQMPGISYGRIVASNGALLAETGAGARLLSDANLADDGSGLSLWSVFSTGSIQVSAPVVSRGQEVGTITLFSRTPDLRDRVLATVWTTLAGALIALCAGLIVAMRMTRRISNPIVALAQMVRKVDRSHDYSAQADIAADGEVADLVAGFNTMLSSIRERDARIAAQVEGLEHEVAARTEELSVAKDAAESANAAKSDFLAVMSHEIRTPLNGILALSDLLAKSDLPQRQQRYADVIAKSGKSLLSIINDILDFSKVEAGKMELEAVELDLSEAAEDVASLFAAKALEKGLDLACYVDPRLPPIQGDPTRLRQVIANLLNNAIKFTETGGVSIEIEPDAAAPSHLTIAIRDTGPGIPADKLPTLFEAFSQVDQSTTRKYGGTGLGLTICDRLVRAMGGEWRLSSELGQGSVFAFSMPFIAAAEVVAPQAGPAGWTLSIGQVGQETAAAIGRYVQALGGRVASPDETETAVTGSDETPAPLGLVVCASEAEVEGVAARWPNACIMVKPIRRQDLLAALSDLSEGRAPSAVHQAADAGGEIHYPCARVLVVDDSEVNREVAVETLGRMGVKPELACDGLEAVEALRLGPYDLVLMDGSMPNLDGFEATRRIRDDEAQSGQTRTPIVALTAHVVGAGAEAWKTCGMDGVVHKPFTLDDIKRVLAQFCAPMAVEATAAPVLPAPEPAPEAAPAVFAPGGDLFDKEVVAELQSMADAGRSDFVHRIQTLYIDNAPLKLAEALAAFEADDAEAAARAAHALKSMSLSLGARAVARQASAIETAARSDAALDRAMLLTLAELVDQTIRQMPGGGAAPPSLTDQLEQAIAAGHIGLAYQPLVDRTGAFSGKVEALVRWTDPTAGPKAPDAFIPELEACGAISRLTDFVLERAMTELADRPEIQVAVNVSASEFRREDFTGRIQRALAANDFPMHRLEIEVTETAMLDVPEARRSLEALRAIGVRVALDDFGAGFTSLHALRDLRFSTLKIDRSFITTCCDDTASAAIIHAVIGVGRALGMQVVCEGVETAEQSEFLRIAGAHLRQGYFHHRPCPAHALPAQVGMALVA
jgi:signal transduction histidine kinase/EAL domain-containing protein (putative c-di-GMP-specific phosphodiesterase class I)/ActR/RegA family two-component response regulator